MSDTNRVKLAYVKQAGLGQIPATPAFQEMRITGAPDLAFTPQTVTSEELRADRQVSDLALVGAQAGGSVPIELSYGSFDDMLEAALFNLWVNKSLREDTDITDVAAGQYNVVAVTGQTFAEGMLCRASGFGEAVNDARFRAEALSSGTQVVYSSAILEAVPPSTARIKQIGFQGVAGDIVATATGLTSTLLDFTTLNLVVGTSIKIGGAAAGDQYDTAPDNDFAVISSIDTNELVLSNLPIGWAADAGTGKTIMVFLGDYLRNGVLKQFMYLEESFNDHDPSITYQYFEDMAINVFELSFPSQSIITGNITFQGTNAEMVTTRVVGATDLPASTTGVMNSSSNVGRIAEGGQIVAGKNFVLEASISINNNLRYQNAVGSIGAIGIGAGEVSVTGSQNSYFDDPTQANKVINNTESSFDIRVNKDDQVYSFDLPRLKYSSGAPTVPGKNQDVTLNAEYQAILDPTFGFTIQVQRFEEIE